MCIIRAYFAYTCMSVRPHICKYVPKFLYVKHKRSFLGWKSVRLQHKSTFKPFLSCNQHFWAYICCVKLPFCGFLSYWSFCGRSELILCHNKPRWDFDLKQRPTLAHYSKGSAQFIITKVFFACIISQKQRATQQKNLELFVTIFFTQIFS